MKKALTLCILCFLTQSLFSQMIMETKPIHYHSLRIKLQQLPQNINFSQQIEHFTFQENRKNSFSLMRNQQQTPAAYAYKDLAFFCKIEVQLEKAVKMPVKFRLGSVDYVDYLEGKRDRY